MGRNLLNVTSVIKVLVVEILLSVIREHTVGRNLLNVISVIKVIPRKVIL